MLVANQPYSGSPRNTSRKENAGKQDSTESVMILEQLMSGDTEKGTTMAKLGSKESCTSAKNGVTAFFIRMSSQAKTHRVQPKSPVSLA
jgi:hypothetical protein